MIGSQMTRLNKGQLEFILFLVPCAFVPERENQKADVLSALLVTFALVPEWQDQKADILSALLN
jgi:hypothetical protein